MIIEERTLKSVKINPKNENVAKIESTPVIGLEMRKLWTAPLLAPSFLRLWAKGTTEQEQTGRGIPNKVAFKTEEIEEINKNKVFERMYTLDDSRN